MELAGLVWQAGETLSEVTGCARMVSWLEPSVKRFGDTLGNQDP